MSNTNIPTLAEVMEAGEYHISEGWTHQWPCFMDEKGYAHVLDFDSEFGSASVCFSTLDQTIHYIEAHSKNSLDGEPTPFRWMNPAIKDKFVAESTTRGIPADDAWEHDDDDGNTVQLKWTETDCPYDMLEKMTAILNGETVDESSVVQVNFTDKELLAYMKMAHQMDITFNEFVNLALSDFLDRMGDFVGGDEEYDDE